jgi:hypothetical protein
MEKRNCEHCRELFTPRQFNQRFCMEECRHAFHSEEKSSAGVAAGDASNAASSGVTAMATADLRQLLADKSEARPGGCVIWTGPIDAKGFGRVYADGMQHQAHRLSYILCISVDIPEGKIVRQRCGHPGCIAAAHLYLGSHADKPRRKQAATAVGVSINRRGL